MYVVKTLLSMKYYYFLDFKTITLINEKYEIFCEQITVLKDEKKLFIFYKNYYWNKYQGVCVYNQRTVIKRSEVKSKKSNSHLAPKSDHRVADVFRLNKLRSLCRNRHSKNSGRPCRNPSPSLDSESSVD